MTVGVANPIPNNYRTTDIKIYRYDDKNLQGIISHPYYDKELPFMNLTRFLFLLEDLMNAIDYPQPAVMDRVYRDQKRMPEADTLPGCPEDWPKEPIVTFRLQIIFRQGATWQGELSWQEGNLSQTFRSALELIKLMDNVLPQPTK